MPADLHNGCTVGMGSLTETDPRSSQPRPPSRNLGSHDGPTARNLAEFHFLDVRLVYVYNTQMKWNDAIRLLGDCEKNLRKLVAEAVAEGDYSSVLCITDLAKAVAALAAEGRATDAPAAAPAAAPPSGTAKGGSDKREARRSPLTGGRTSRQPRDDYPKFFRRGDELVKVGWSKKDRKEYNHRAPRQAVDAVAVAVRQVGAKGKLFNGDALLPLKDPSNGAAVPDYQAYVALAWLKHLGVVEQRGRRAGYTLVPSKHIESTMTTAWPELAEWRG
jgi:hypothetical protein